VKTYEINIINPNETTDVHTHYVRTDAEKMDVQNAINFVKMGGERSVDKLLVALRVLGFTAREQKVEAEESFDM
jgi:hypothetical protein